MRSRSLLQKPCSENQDNLLFHVTIEADCCETGLRFMPHPGLQPTENVKLVAYNIKKFDGYTGVTLKANNA